MRTHAPAVVLIVVVAGGIFANALGAVFLWDDNKIILENPQIRDPARALRAFGLGYWRRIRAGEKPAADRHYRPVVELSFAVDYAVWKLSGVGCHLTNVAIHIANSLLIYLLVYRVLRRTVWAALCGLLFAAHPIHVEAIAWAKCRSELLALLFMLASLLLQLRWRRPVATIRGAGLYAGSVACYGLALASKASAVVLPLLLALYLWCFIDGPRLRRGMLGLLPLLGVGMAFLAFYVAVSGQPSPAAGMPSYQRLLTTIAVTGAYLRLLALPSGVCLVHDFGPPRSVLEPGVLAGLLWSLIAAIGAVAAWRRSKPAFFALAWLLVAMIPMSAVPGALRRLVADSRAYIPSVGFCMLVVLLLQGIPALGRAPSARRALHRASLAVGGLLVAAYAGLTIDRNIDWSDRARLFAHTVTRHPRMHLLRIDLASIYILRGDLEAAIPQLREALTIQPDNVHALKNLARTCRYTQRYEEAVLWYTRLLQYQPHDVAARIDLGMTYAHAGQPAKAIDQFEAALRLDPDNVAAHYDLAAVYMRLGRHDDAAAELQHATRLQPGDATIHHALGVAYATMDDPTRAIRAFSESLCLEPDSDETWLAMGEAYERLGDTAEAMRSYRRCARLGGSAADEADRRLDRLLGRQGP